MKTIIAGSRGIDNETFLKALETCPFLEEVGVVVSGTARGVDKFGESWAEWKDIPIMRFPAAWRVNGHYISSAGYTRNVEMAECADALIAIWDGTSRGTAHMIRVAKDKGLRVYVWNALENNG